MKRYSITARHAAAALALAAAAMLPGIAAAECGDPACAQKAESCEQAKAAGGCGCAEKAAAGAAGQQAYVDPKTGELAVPPAQAGGAAGGEVASRAEGQPAAVASPGGGVEVEAGAGIRSEMVATTGENGEVKAKCSHAGAKHE